MKLAGVPEHLLGMRRVPELAMFNQPRAIRMGVLDEAALYVYTRGQCAPLAVALHREYGWPIVGVWDADDGCAPDHMLAQVPEGRLLDIYGIHDPVAIVELYDGICDEAPHELGDVDPFMVEEWVRDESLPRPDYLAAHVMAIAVVQRYLPGMSGRTQLSRVPAGREIFGHNKEA